MLRELEDEKRKHEHDTAQGDDITYGLEKERTRLREVLNRIQLSLNNLNFISIHYIQTVTTQLNYISIRIQVKFVVYHCQLAMVWIGNSLVEF